MAVAELGHVEAGVGRRGSMRATASALACVLALGGVLLSLRFLSDGSRCVLGGAATQLGQGLSSAETLPEPPAPVGEEPAPSPARPADTEVEPSAEEDATAPSAPAPAEPGAEAAEATDAQAIVERPTSRIDLLVELLCPERPRMRGWAALESARERMENLRQLRSTCAEQKTLLFAGAGTEADAEPR